jgi:hypothetical protein
MILVTDEYLEKKFIMQCLQFHQQETEVQIEVQIEVQEQRDCF